MCVCTCSRSALARTCEEGSLLRSVTKAHCILQPRASRHIQLRTHNLLPEQEVRPAQVSHVRQRHAAALGRGLLYMRCGRLITLACKPLVRTQSIGQGCMARESTEGVTC